VTPEATSALEATAEATAETTAEATAESTAQASAKPTAASTAQPTAEATKEATPETTPEATAQAFYGEGDGYLFLIQGAGAYSILRARGRDLQPLVQWTNSAAINQGPVKNHLRAICVGDYLAFWINDKFVADVTDDAYLGGQVGLAASSSDRLGIRVDFDNLQVSEGKQG
jgi:hypothetical protein